MYATLEDLKKRLPEEVIIGLTDDEDLGVVHVERTEAALETASITIDGYIAGRYELPLESPPNILSVHCVSLAGHFLHERRDQISEAWKIAHDGAVKFLEKVANGTISLGAGDPHGTGDIETLSVAAPDPLLLDKLDQF